MHENGPEFLALQEVGGTGSLASALREASNSEPLSEYSLSDCVCSSYYVLGTADLNSYLAQVILLSKGSVEYIADTYKGERMIGVKYASSATHNLRWIFTVHLPHGDNSDAMFEDALAELTRVCQAYSETEALIIGDFNAEFGSPRAVLLDAALSPFGFSCFRSDIPTRHGSTSSSSIDYAYISRALKSQTVSTPVGQNQLLVHCGSRHDIQSDHDRVTLALHLGAAAPKRTKRRKPKARARCAKWLAGSNLPECLAVVRPSFETLSLQGQWECLQSLQQASSYNTPSKKYRDSPYLKDLCHQRRFCTDLDKRLELTRAILAKRRAERLLWLQSLEDDAASGDAHAISYLRARLKPHGDFQPLVKDSGGLGEAAARVKRHFDTLFHPDVPQEQRQEIQGILESLQLESGAHMLAEFTDAEIQEALNKGKSGKTSGLTGITYELLVAMWGVEDGRTILRQFLNNLFTASQHPQGLYRAFVLLIPKVAQVAAPTDIRPINLIEACNKLYCHILLRRLVASWSTPPCQCGGVAGSQVLDALATAHWMVYNEGVLHQHRIWFNADIRSAFDSLQHVAVARWISESTPSHLAREALQLLRVVLQPQLVFAWKGVQWEVSQAQGVQQGHTYSSGVFSFIIGHLLQQEFQRCRADGFDSVVGDWGWLFIDDLLLHFDDWNTAIKLLPRIQDALSAVGLAFNLTKTQLMASPATLAAGRELVLPAGHVLSKVPWVDLTQYLRKPLRHLRVGENLWHLWQPFFVRSVHHGLQQMLPVLRGLNWLQPNLALTILNRYIGSKWLWASPVVPPTVHALDSIRTLQATALQTLLQLHIPTLLQKPQAMVLHRLRKRAVYLFLNDKIPQTWTFQWQLRFWNYFGHVLRRPPEAPVRAAVSSMIRMRRPQGGFPNSPLDWLLRCAAKAFNAVVSPVEIFALAADRLAWKLRGACFFEQQALAQLHSRVNSGLFPRWQDYVLQHAVWLFTCTLCVGEQGFVLVWIDNEQGLQTWTLCDDLQMGLYHFAITVRMLHPYFLLHCALAEAQLEAHLPTLHRVADVLQEQCQILLTFNVIPERYIRKIATLQD